VRVDRALNLIVTASATILVAVIVATAIAGALTRRSSSAGDNQVRSVRVRDRRPQHHKVVRGPDGAYRVVDLRFDSG
jgi:hypothetical protein